MIALAQGSQHAIGPSSADADGAFGYPGPPEWQRLGRGMPVRFRDGGVGTVEELWFDPQRTRFGHMVVHVVTPPGHEISVSFDHVLAVDEWGAVVDVDAVPGELLPEHSTAP